MCESKVTRLWATTILILGIAGCGGPPAATPIASQPAAAPAPANDPNAPSPLRWKFAAGDAYLWECTLQNELEAPQEDDVVKVITNMTIDFDAEVASVDGDNGVLKISVPRIRAQGQMRDTKYKFDSDATEVDPDDEEASNGQLMGETLKMLFDLKMTAHVDSRGVVTQLDVDPELKEKFAMFRPAQATAILLEPQGLNSLFFGGLIPMPEQPLKPGDTWTEVFTSPKTLGSTKFEMTFTPRYEGPEQTSDGAHDVFLLDTKMDFGDAAEGHMKLGEQTSEGRLVFDRAAGHVAACDWKCDAELVFGDGEATGRMLLGLKSKLAKRSVSP